MYIYMYIYTRSRIILFSSSYVSIFSMASVQDLVCAMRSLESCVSCSLQPVLSAVFCLCYVQFQIGPCMGANRACTGAWSLIIGP